MLRRTLSLATVVTFLATSIACSHAVVIESDPAGAEIKVNGEKLGTSPVTYSETTGWEKVYDIEATAPGYKPVRKEVKQEEWNIPVTAASGIAIISCVGLPGAIGLLFARQLPDKIVVHMDRGGPGVADPGAVPPPSNYGY